MANILHRAHFSADAAILAHAALDLTSDLFTSHYTLGNIYAVSRSQPATAAAMALLKHRISKAVEKQELLCPASAVL